MTYWKCDIYRLTDDKEKLQAELDDLKMKYQDLDDEHKTTTKKLKDADKQLVTNFQQIQSLNQDKERVQKELSDLEGAALELVHMVDPAVCGRTLLERLRDAPTSIAGYASGTANVVLAHVLALVKTYVPQMRMEDMFDGAAEGSTEDQFNEYYNGTLPVATRIVDDLRDQLF